MVRVQSVAPLKYKERFLHIMKAAWEECRDHVGCSARNYADTDCPNCPYKDNDDKDCLIKRDNEHARRERYERLKEWTVWNAN